MPAARPAAPPAPRVDRHDRLDLVARVLRDRPGTTAAELAREFGVSVRSVFRDLDRLRERGYPIESSRGRGGGLRLHRSWGLGRVRLAREEALVTLLGLAIAERLGFPLFAGELRAARRKVVDLFPADERRRVGPLRERIFVGAPASAAVRRSYGEPVAAAMRRLQVAFVEERVVRVEYAREDGTRTERRLEPHALLVNWPAWYLLAHDELRGAGRTFRLDRFTAVTPEAGRFRPHPRAHAAALLADAGVVLERL